MNSEIITVAIGILLGGVVSFVGFQYKKRKEIREKINESLYHLLEVWTFIGLIKFLQSTDYQKTLIERIKYKFPKENITEEVEEQIRKETSESMPTLIDTMNPSDGSYLEKYLSSVKDLAKIYPVLAFDLNKNQFLMKLLGEFDKFTKNKEANKTDKIAINKITQFFYKESFQELEGDLIKLSFKSGLQNYYLTRKHINRLKMRQNKIPISELDNYISEVIAPTIQAHYDNLGVANPNLANQ